MPDARGPAASPRPGAPGTSWPGRLVDRALSALSADYQRPTGPIVVAGLLAVVALLIVHSSHGPPFGFPLAALSLAATVPVAVIRRWPRLAITVLLAANSGFILFGRLNWPVTAMIGWVIALAACPLMLRRARAVQVLAVSELVVVLAVVRHSGNYTPWDATLAEALAVVAAWGAGELLQARRQTAIERAAAADQVRSLTERDALARERAAIARELHDVVAHHVSMIAVRAGTTPYGSPAQYREAFDEIAKDARTALAELRVVLGVLRDPAAVSAAAPQPSMSDLQQLLGRVRGAGADVQLQVTGLARPLRASAELCGYRIVQEAVTNAGRHAPGSRVLVCLRYRLTELEITVTNGRAADLPAATGREPGSPGFGLVGLRERVALLGGDFRAGPHEDGGFTVCAVLPVAPGRAELEAESA
jgi:signal transduction histidine kinase